MKISKFSLILILGLFFSHSSLKAQNSNPIILKEISKIGFTEDDTPEYKFSSTHEGDLIYSGKCKSSTKKAEIGENIINLDSLINGIYFDCKIKLKDVFGKFSNELSISRFTINKAAENNNSNNSGGSGGRSNLSGIIGAIAGALGGTGGGQSDCKETGPPKCSSQTLKISPQQCKHKSKDSSKPPDAVKQSIKSYKQHLKKFDKDVAQKIYKDNQASPQCSNRASAKGLHNFNRCVRDVAEGYLKDCAGANSAGIIPLRNYAFHNDSVSEKIKNFFFLPTVSANAGSIISNLDITKNLGAIKTMGNKLDQAQRLKMHTIVSQNANMKKMSLEHANVEQELNDNKNILQPLMQENINQLRQYNSTKTANIPNPQVCKPPKCSKQPETFKPKNFTNFIIPPSSSGGGGTCISNEHAILKPKTTIANGEIVKTNIETQIVSFDLENKASCSIELDKLKIFLVGNQITSSEKIKLSLYYKVNNQEKKVDEIEILPQEADKAFDLKKLIMPANSELEFNIAINAPVKFKNKNFFLDVKASKNIDVWDGEIAQTEPYSIKSSSFVITE